MYSLLFGALLASFASSAFAGVARYPQPPESNIASTDRRHLVQRDSEQTEDFQYSKYSENIVDIELEENKFKLDCIECELTGSVTATYDEKLPDIWSSNLKLSFTEIKGSFDLDVVVGTGDEQVIPLWSLGGVSLGSSSTTLGVGLYLELVVTLSGELEATGGFNFTIPKGSWITASLEGDIVDASFNGSESSMIPWQVSSSSTTLKASIRLRTEVGVTADTPLVDVSAELAAGVYLNIIEVIVTLENNEDDATCALEVSESWNINAAIYAGVDIGDSSITVGVTPELTTTFVEGTIGTQCLDQASQTITTATASATGLPGTLASSTPEGYATRTAFESGDCDEQSSTPLQTFTSKDTTTTEPGLPKTTVRSTAASESDDCDDEQSSTTLQTLASKEIAMTEPGMPTTTLRATAPSESDDCDDEQSSTTLQTLTSKETVMTEPGVPTTTVRSTSIYTATRCVASVSSCHTDAVETVIVTQIVDVYTTICPSTAYGAKSDSTDTTEVVTVTQNVVVTVGPTPA